MGCRTAAGGVRGKEPSGGSEKRSKDCARLREGARRSARIRERSTRTEESKNHGVSSCL